MIEESGTRARGVLWEEGNLRLLKIQSAKHGAEMGPGWKGLGTPLEAEAAMDNVDGVTLSTKSFSGVILPQLMPFSTTREDWIYHGLDEA